MIVFLSSARHISSIIARIINIYLLICSTIFSAIARVFCSLQLEKNSEIHAFTSQIDVFFSLSSKTTIWLLRSHLIYFICSTSFFRFSTSIFITIRNIWRKNTRLFVKSTRLFLFRSKNFDFNSSVMNSIFLFLCDNKASNFFSLKTLFTYDERLAILKFCLKFFETFRHFKTIMIVVNFSKDNNSDFNVMQCTICSLLIYDEYFTLESLKKHFQNASHCSLVIQFQKEIEMKIVKEKIVKKSKIEFFSVSFVKFLSTYEEKLASFQYWIWTKTNSTKEFLIVVEFKCIDDEYRTKCMHCSLKIANNRDFESLKKHLQKSFECLFVLQLEIAKFIFVAVDIEYFDSILLCDIQKFDLHHETIIFCQHLQSIRANYREIDLVELLNNCLRDSALTWYKKQNEIVKNLNEWLEILIIAFSAKSFAKFEIQTFASNATSLLIFSSQYHSCLNCFAFFSSLTRLLQHIQIACRKVVCKQCEKTFDSKNKFHEHIRQHHATKKMNKMISRRNCNKKKNKISSISSTISTISTTISSKTTTNFSISRSVTISEQTRNSFTSFATFSSKSRKSISKFYFTIDDLIRMFREKFKSFDLSQHQKRRLFSRNFDIFYQSRIIVYFLFAINQKTSISQSLKSSNSKSFQQHTFAKSISLCCFASILSKKSIISSYKKSNIFFIFLQSKFSFWFFFTFSSLFGFSLSDFHVCCICFDRFSFRNDLFDYRRFSQRYFLNRRSIGEIWKKYSFRDEIWKRERNNVTSVFWKHCRKVEKNTWLEFWHSQTLHQIFRFSFVHIFFLVLEFSFNEYRLSCTTVTIFWFDKKIK